MTFREWLKPHHPIEILRPDMFDWETLRKTILDLSSCESVYTPHYKRGYGWVNDNLINSADVVIVDGLFLDSEECNQVIDFDMYILMMSTDDLIRKFRMKRDDYYRQNSDSFSRSKEETELEIKNCILSNKLYNRSKSIDNVFKVFIYDKHCISEIE